MLLYTMLYIVLAYLMLFAALTNSVCLNNASFFFLFKYFLCQGYELSGEIALKITIIIIIIIEVVHCLWDYMFHNIANINSKRSEFMSGCQMNGMVIVNWVYNWIYNWVYNWM